MMAYGLTKQEQTITQLVCRGLSTRELGGRLHITANTVQDHLKSIFDKTGVRSRRELVAAILQEQFLPRAMAGQPIGPSGPSGARSPSAVSASGSSARTHDHARLKRLQPCQALGTGSISCTWTWPLGAWKCG
jgi:DNA-binding CsgD family transcriptional regulator